MTDSREETLHDEPSPDSSGPDEFSATVGQRSSSAAPLPQFVTALASLEQQVGTHVIGALQHPGTIAVLSTVVAGMDGSQQVVSIGLDADRFVQVQELLTGAMDDQKRRVQCLGFHCQFVDDEVGIKEDPTKA